MDFNGAVATRLRKPGDAVRFTFDHAKANFRVLLTPANAATAASQGAGTYAVNYWIFY